MGKRLFPFSIVASDPVPSDLSLEAAFTLEAAASVTDGQKPSPRKFNIVANTGVPFRQGHLPHPVILDLEAGGIEFAKQTTPVIMDHKADKRIGHTTSQTIDRKNFKITAEGVVSSKSQSAKEFIEDAAEGFPFQSSFQADVKAGYQLDKGESAVVNGKRHEGPLIVAQKALINELTVTVLGADNNTSVKLAAHRTLSLDVQKDVMDFTTWLKAMGLVESNLSADQITALKAQHAEIKTLKAGGPLVNDDDSDDDDDDDSDDYGKKGGKGKKKVKTSLRASAVADEELRIDSIKEIAATYNDTFKGKDAPKIKADGKDYTFATLKATAIREGWEANQYELHLMRAERSVATTLPAPSVHVQKQLRDLSNEVISAAACRQLGVPTNRTHEVTEEKYGLEVWYSPEVLEASHHKMLKHISLHQLMDLAIIAHQGYGYSGNRKSDDFIEACRTAMFRLAASGGSGSSTLNVSNIFDDVANKLLLSAYASVPTTWQEWVGVKSVDDFKAHNLYRLTMTGAYEPVGADGQIAHGGFTDSKTSITTDTYAKMVGLTRKDLINDDLGALQAIMTMLGLEGAKTLEEVSYVYLLANLGTLFTTGLKNKSSGAGSALAIAGLAAAAKLFEDQVDADNAPIGLNPDRILTGTTLGVLAGQLYNDVNILEGQGSTATKEFFTRNQYANRFKPIKSPYIDNTNIKKRIGKSKGTAITGQSAALWFMFGNPADPLGAFAYMAFLNGVRTPSLAQSDMQFNMLGLQWRAVHDFNINAGDSKLGVQSVGS